MNKYQKAFGFLLTSVRETKDLKLRKDPQLYEALHKLEELVNRTTPKKPSIEVEDNEED